MVEFRAAANELASRLLSAPSEPALGLPLTLPLGVLGKRKKAANSEAEEAAPSPTVAVAPPPDRGPAAFRLWRSRRGCMGAGLSRGQSGTETGATGTTPSSRGDSLTRY